MKATVIGSINYDILVHQSRFTQVGETFVANELWSGGGGKGANQAVQLTKLGIPTTLIGAIGDDIFGEILLRELLTHNVNTDCISIYKGGSGIGLVTAISNGDVTASIIPGANTALSKQDIDKNLTIIQSTDIILYQMEIPIDVMVHSFEYISEHTYVILNAAPAKSLPDYFWARIDCLIINELEATFYSGIDVASLETAQEAIIKIQSFTKKDIAIIITLGEKGCLVSKDSKTLFIPALKVKCIESTGAGDSFIGAFASYYLTDPDIFKAAEFGTKVASITVQGIGAQNSMPTIMQLS